MMVNVSESGIGHSHYFSQKNLSFIYRFPSTVHIETDIKPGEFVMRTLFAEFTVQGIQLTENQYILSSIQTIQKRTGRIESVSCQFSTSQKGSFR